MSSTGEKAIQFNEKVNIDCRYFFGDRPCKPHKAEGVHCQDCSHYEQITKRVLIIKLGAVGDVIRTTPLLHALGKTGVHITWLTDTPEILPHDQIDRVLKLDAAVLAYLQATSFNTLYNLDKDPQAIALAILIRADEKHGFTMDNGVSLPMDWRSHDKWMTGLFDDLNKANRISYPEEIFTMCGLKFKGEKYIVNVDDSPSFDLDLAKPIIGLNTGCGARWPSRLWKIEKWVELAKSLQKNGLGVLLLGGPDEDERNRRIALESGAMYVGTFPLQRFLHLIDEVDLLVTGVTMAMHIGIGLQKRIVLLNNIFNRYEFELYGLGQIVEPDVDCLGCFKPVCDQDCMNLVPAQEVYDAVMEELKK